MSVVFTEESRAAVESLKRRQASALTELLHLACDRKPTAGSHEMVYTVEVMRTSYGTAWVAIRPDIPTLGEDNLLRNLERIETWHVHIGKRGKLEAWTYPKSLQQFAGKTWCGINIMLTELEKKRRAEKRSES